MAEARVITSSSNQAYKQAVRMTKSKEARAESVFMVEGVRSVREVLGEKAWHVREIWISEELKRKDASLYEQLLHEADATLFVAPEEMVRKLSDTMTPQGIVAFVERKIAKVSEILEKCREKKETPLLVILENLQDPGNVGTILRTLDAAGGHGLILTKGTCDIYSPKVIRSTMGSLLHTDCALVESAEPLILALKKAGFTVVAGDLSASDLPYDVDMKKPLAILIGNEGNGLTKEAAEAATHKIRIPMRGEAESLNASVAAGVLIYEAVRQRL